MVSHKSPLQNTQAPQGGRAAAVMLQAVRAIVVLNEFAQGKDFTILGGQWAAVGPDGTCSPPGFLDGPGQALADSDALLPASFAGPKLGHTGLDAAGLYSQYKSNGLDVAKLIRIDGGFGRCNRPGVQRTRGTIHGPDLLRRSVDFDRQ